MKKKPVFIFILSLMIAFIYFALYPLPAMAETHIDLRGAIDRALSQNRSLMLIYVRLSSAYDRYDKASTAMEREKAKKDIDDLLNQRDEKQKDIEINVTKLYHEILIKQKQVLLQQEIVERLKREYESKKKLFELGRDTVYTVLNSEASLYDGQAKLYDLNDELQNLYMDLNIEMGDEVGKKLILADEPIPEEEFEIENLDKIADAMLYKSYSIKSIEKDLSLSYDELNSADLEDERQQALDKINELSINLNDERANVEYKVFSEYNNVLNKRDDEKIKRLDYEKKMKLSDAARIRYSHGLVTDMDYDRANQDARDAMYAYLFAKLYYYIENKKYKNYIAPAL